MSCHELHKSNELELTILEHLIRLHELTATLRSTIWCHSTDIVRVLASSMK